MPIIKMNMNFSNNSQTNTLLSNNLYINNLTNVNNNIKMIKAKNRNCSALIFEGKKTCGTCGRK